MPDTTPTDDAIAPIFQKWRRYKFNSLLVTVACVFLCGMTISFLAYLAQGHISKVGRYIAVFFGSIIGIAVSHYRIKTFVKTLSLDEREVLLISAESAKV